MLNWFIQNVSSVIVALVLAVICSLIILKMIKDKKKGKTSCGCGCQSCSIRGACHPQKDQ